MTDAEREKAAKAERNRNAMPGVAAIVDQVRAEFGPGVRVLWAKEGDKQIGRKETA